MSISRVCVFCASSTQVHPEYFDASNRLGKELAKQDLTIIYGGGGAGLMGEVATAALAEGGKVIGILPRFMSDLEWGHTGLTELKLVDDMRERKQMMIEDVDAVVALPGGCGTLEELLEVITLKRLGIFLKPIILVNVRGFFDPQIEMLNKCINERFMNEKHKSIWSVASKAEEVVETILSAPKWDASSRNFATL